MKIDLEALENHICYQDIQTEPFSIDRHRWCSEKKNFFLMKIIRKAN